MEQAISSNFTTLADQERVLATLPRAQFLTDGLLN